MNERFRSWTRGSTFTLAMGRAQVAVLVALHATPENNGWHIGSYHPRLSRWVTGVRGLEERGLVNYTDPNVLKKKLKRYATAKEIWQLTTAGLLVCDLLKISGVYQELMQQFEQSDKQRMREVS